MEIAAFQIIGKEMEITDNKFTRIVYQRNHAGERRQKRNIGL